MPDPSKSDTINYIKSMKIEIKSLSARINYLTRFVVQQKRQLDSALKKISSLEQSSKYPLNRSIGVSHSPQSTRSVGCQISPGTNPLVSLSPDVNELSSNSESFEGLNKCLQPSNSVNLPRCCTPQKKPSPFESPSTQNGSVISLKKKKRRSSVIPTELRKTKKNILSSYQFSKTPERNVHCSKERHVQGSSQKHSIK
ncbi:unnamed protein product [Schistosoma turkestanicum]|nr:unnamed protein product [Schistosoma turkestanicum]